MTKNAWAGRLLAGASFWDPDFPGGSAWMEHTPFAFWLVNASRPRTFVELGTHTGVSYLAFCQAVSRLQIAAKCFAVDTWEGDEHTGPYGAEVLAELASYHDPKYGGFSQLVQSTFDEAVDSFEDRSIDLLHIDGLHTYDAVGHDFDTWRPKLSERAIVLFHDTNVRERGFGVHRVWAELRTEHPAFEFMHAHGLGVLGVGEKTPARVAALFRANADPEVTADVRAAYAHLGSAVRLRWDLSVARNAIRADEDRLAALTERLTAREAEVSSLEEIRAVLESHLREATAQAAASQASAADLQNQLSITLGSRSWRLTRPLRTGVQLTRRIAHRPDEWLGRLHRGHPLEVDRKDGIDDASTGAKLEDNPDSREDADGLVGALLDDESRVIFLHAYMPREGDIVVDAGAGDGTEVLTFSRLVGQSGKVVAIEAHPEAFDDLRELCEREELGNVELVHAALVARSEVTKISDQEEPALNSTVVTMSNGISVTATTLDEVVRGLGVNDIDLLKMNIEGAEVDALEGFTQGIRRTRHVCIACHDFLADDGRGVEKMRTKESVRRFLERAGFSVTSQSHEMPWISDSDYLYGTIG